MLIVYNFKYYLIKNFYDKIKDYKLYKSYYFVDVSLTIIIIEGSFLLIIECLYELMILDQNSLFWFGYLRLNNLIRTSNSSPIENLVVEKGFITTLMPNIKANINIVKADIKMAIYSICGSICSRHTVSIKKIMFKAKTNKLEAWKIFTKLTTYPKFYTI